MYQSTKRNWKVWLLTFIILFFSIFSFSCTTLSSLGKEPAKKSYPAYSTALLNIPSVSKYVNNIADNLAKQAFVDTNVDVVVVRTSRVQSRNFRGTPRIEVARGMLNLMTNEAELACLISHEIGHKVLHGKGDYKKEQEDKSFKDKFGDIFLSDEEQLARWSQKREQEADEYGATICRKAGYDAYALVGFFDRLSQFQEKGFLASLREISATHKDFQSCSKHLRKYLEKSGMQPGDGILNEKEYQQSLVALKGVRTNDVVNEVLPGGASSTLQKLDSIEDELRRYERAKEPLSVVRFIDIMEELRSISEKYGINISSIKTASIIYPLTSTYYVFMKEVLSPDTPVWGEEGEIERKVEDVLTLLGRIGVGFIPVVGDAVDLYELLVGEDFITGVKLTLPERVITAVALLAGSGKMWREVAGGIDETLDGAKLAKRVGKGSIKESKKALNRAEKIIESSSGVKKGKTVIGRYPRYVELADEIGTRKLDVPMNVWNKMSSAEKWTANQKFLDRLVKRGDEIILATPVENINDVTGYFRQELDYLIKKGYQLSVDGTKLIKP